MIPLMLTADVNTLDKDTNAIFGAGGWTSIPVLQAKDHKIRFCPTLNFSLIFAMIYFFFALAHKWLGFEVKIECKGQNECTWLGLGVTKYKAGVK